MVRGRGSGGSGESSRQREAAHVALAVCSDGGMGTALGTMTGKVEGRSGNGKDEEA